MKCFVYLKARKRFHSESYFFSALPILRCTFGTGRQDGKNISPPCRFSGCVVLRRVGKTGKIFSPPCRFSGYVVLRRVGKTGKIFSPPCRFLRCTFWNGPARRQKYFANFLRCAFWNGPARKIRELFLRLGDFWNALFWDGLARKIREIFSPPMAIFEVRCFGTGRQENSRNIFPALAIFWSASLWNGLARKFTKYFLPWCFEAHCFGCLVREISQITRDIKRD